MVFVIVKFEKFVILVFVLIQVKEDEMGRECSTNEVVDEHIYDIGGKARRKETTGKTKT
jgi:hypothetical protein